MDLIDPTPGFTRTETVKSSTDCFVLYINKTDFSNLFDHDDFEVFREHHKRTYPVTYDAFVKKVQQ